MMREKEAETATYGEGESGIDGLHMETKNQAETRDILGRIKR
jgi:hypothetical protein